MASIADQRHEHARERARRGYIKNKKGQWVKAKTKPAPKD